MATNSAEVRRGGAWPWPLLGGCAVAVTAVAGSLYFSEIRHFEPCLLCWYQRILMYPLAVIMGFALITRVSVMAWLVLGTAVVGQAVAAYHVLLQKTSWFSSATTCGTGPSCAIPYIDWFGIVTIPMLSLTAFMLIAICMVLYLNGAGIDGGDPVQLTFDPRSTAVFGGMVLIAVATFLVLRSQQLAAEVAPLAMEPVVPATSMQSTPADDSDSGVSVPGAVLFADNCAACHGGRGEGITGLTPPLLDSEKVGAMSEQELRALVRAGVAQDDPDNQTGNLMPEFGPNLVSDEDLAVLVAWLKTELQR
ncbi:MAG: disulfide bond formation protein B [Caldilineaceae bacterium SB0665_bin_21]|nr:disulfide bond formation protein B [Caldilineaceae bacterium SB0665_bin_21]MYA05724.1 disulfide bond formation protein B [Caldilineaceae bacterium SB0664_bin_22]